MRKVRTLGPQKAAATYSNVRLLMMKNSYSYILLLLIISMSAMANNNVNLIRIYLYQQDNELGSHLQNQDEFIEYIGKVESSIIQAIENSPIESPRTGAVVVAINTKGELRLWYVFENQLNESIKAKVLSSIKQNKIPKLNSGPVMFGYGLNLWGANGSINGIPIPEEWKSIADANNKPLTVNELVNKAW